MTVKSTASGVRADMDVPAAAEDTASAVGELSSKSKKAMGSIWGEGDDTVSSGDPMAEAAAAEAAEQAAAEQAAADKAAADKAAADKAAADKAAADKAAAEKVDLGVPEELLAGKKEAKPDESDEADPVPEKLSAKDREAFIHKTQQVKEWKTKAKTLEAKSKDLETRIHELEDQVKFAKAAPAAAEATRIAELEAKLQEAQNQLGQYDLSATETFQRQYDVPLSMLLRKATKLLTTARRPEDQAANMVTKILSAGNRDELVELLVDEPLPVQGAIFSLVNDVSEIRESRAAALENWKSSRAAVEEEHRRDAKSRLVQNIVQSTDKAAMALQAEGNLLLTKLNDNPEWNAAVDQRVDIARGILHQGDPEAITKLVMDGVTAPVQRDLYRKLYAAYQKLQAEAQALVSGGARLSGAGDAPPAKVKSAAPVTGKDIMDNTWGKEE